MLDLLRHEKHYKMNIDLNPLLQIHHTVVLKKDSKSIGEIENK
jgi:hypothetical protein